MLEDIEGAPQPSFWPSVSDLFMTLFIIALVLMATVYYAFLPTSPQPWEPVVEAVGGFGLDKIREPVNRMRIATGSMQPLPADLPANEVVHELSLTANTVVQELALLKTLGPNPGSSLKDLLEANKKLEEQKLEIARLTALLVALQREMNDKPPIIRIAEAGKDGKAVYRFETGKAIVSPEFTTALHEGGFKEVAEEIIRRNAGARKAVDTIEIIGHTDGVAFARSGNLDAYLPDFLSGNRKTLTGLIPGSNNDLGLLRALAIKEAWLDFVKQHPQGDL